MIDNAKKMNNNSITRINGNSLWYHKYTEDATKIRINLVIFTLHFIQIFIILICNCVSFYKLFVCKHLEKLSDLS